MAEKFKVHIEAERFIHNELGSVAFHLMQLVHTKIAEDDKEGIGLLMIACLTFFAFEVEAQVNFVGWKVFGDDWKEREKLERKINILCAKLAIKKRLD
ncbi:hypothetical protein [Ruegeria arenilitoris]|uniref:hypothetical protein n=1 Tax=Ruegeria arenilitoris TaxID=1173585 RepID=UPI00147D638F|nr:hypothetical protein [Ruegeria arenilitoris]